jgi:hypothetical protein
MLPTLARPFPDDEVPGGGVNPRLAPPYAGRVVPLGVSERVAEVDRPEDDVTGTTGLFDRRVGEIMLLTTPPTAEPVPARVTGPARFSDDDDDAADCGLDDVTPPGELPGGTLVVASRDDDAPKRLRTAPALVTPVAAVVDPAPAADGLREPGDDVEGDVPPPSRLTSNVGRPLAALLLLPLTTPLTADG